MDSRRAIINAATILIAEEGVRGASIRKIGARSGLNPSQVTARFSSKNQLIAACFAEAVKRDIAQLQALAHEQRAMAMGPEIAAKLLWTICEDAAGVRRRDNLVLIEGVLAAVELRCSDILCRWILRRQAILREMAARAGLDPLAFEILGLVLLSECGFAVSNQESTSYRIVAKAGFELAFARLTGVGRTDPGDDLLDLADRYYLNVDDIREPADGDTSVGVQDNKHRIIEAAVAIIRDQGVDLVTNRAVAARAGVSLGLTTYYFKTVSDLIAAALDRMVQTIAINMDRRLGPSDLQSFMENLVRNWSQPGTLETGIYREVLLASLAATRANEARELAQRNRRQLGILAYEAIRTNKKPKDASRMDATAFSLWCGAVVLIAPALGEAGESFDFEAQAALISDRVLDPR